MCYTRKPTPEQALYNVFETLNIDTAQKTVLQDRYIRVLENFHTRAGTLGYAFYSTRSIITVGSILVPAFLSIQNSCNNQNIYWVTWVLSLAVTICNGFMTLFKLDKRYYFINTTLEMLHSEGWQYIGLTGRYSGKDSTIPPTHENQFTIFFRMAEKIKMRQVEEEYWKFTDTSGVGNATNHTTLLTSSTPAVQQGGLDTLSTDKKTIIDGWLEDIKKKQLRGLQPRIESTIFRSEDTLNTPKVDESDGSSGVWKSPLKATVSMRPALPEASSSESPELQLSQDDEIPKNTIVKIV
jgi:hypothetical protein